MESWNNGMSGGVRTSYALLQHAIVPVFQSLMLDILFHSKSIALIGASRTSGKVGFAVLSNL